MINAINVNIFPNICIETIYGKIKRKKIRNFNAFATTYIDHIVAIQIASFVVGTRGTDGSC